MTLSSQLALEDVGALFLGPSFLMADPMGPLLDQDEEEALSPPSFIDGRAASSPSHSFSSYASSPVSFSSPPPSPPPPTYPLFVGTKAREDSLSFPWFGASDLLDADVRADNGKEDAFTGMEWMTEKIDLSDFDLDSLMGSCASDEPPSSSEELLASLNSHMDLELDTFDASIPTSHDALGLGLSLPDLPLEFHAVGAEVKQQGVAPEQEVVVKSEPSSPAPPLSPHSPVYTLDLELGSEVDVLDAGKATSTITVIPDPCGNVQTATPIVIALPTTTHFVVVLTTPKDESTLVPLPESANKTSPASNDCDSDSGIESIPSSPPNSATSPSAAGSSRTKPYSRPELTSPSPKAPRVKSVSGAPKVEKKIKKMEQNKTAATRYRQKKRVEQDVLLSECTELEKKNNVLRDKAESISREIQYLKDLMEEVRNRRSKTSTVA